MGPTTPMEELLKIVPTVNILLLGSRGRREGIKKAEMQERKQGPNDSCLAGAEANDATVLDELRYVSSQSWQIACLLQRQSSLLFQLTFSPTFYRAVVYLTFSLLQNCRHLFADTTGTFPQSSLSSKPWRNLHRSCSGLVRAHHSTYTLQFCFFVLYQYTHLPVKWNQCENR